MPKIYTNPRMVAEVPNWPLGGDRRGPARFFIEQHAKRGERAVRVTTGKPVTRTYALKARIVDGDDGRTYILELGHWGSLSVQRGDMKFIEEHIAETDPRYPALRALFEAPGSDKLEQLLSDAAAKGDV